MHPAEQIVMLINRVYQKGLTTTSGGNLSIMDSEGVIWITPSGIDKGSLTPADICKVLPDGTVIGKHKPSVELPFHKLVYKTRPDVSAVLHAHPPALVSFSLIRKAPDVNIIPTPHQVCGEVGIAKYEVPGSEALGKNVAAAFAAASVNSPSVSISYSVPQQLQSFQVLWQREQDSFLTAFIPQLSQQSSILLKLTGHGAAAGSQQWDSTISQVLTASTW